MEERINNYQNNKTNPDYITSSYTQVAAVLSNQIDIIEPLLEEVELFLKAIDDTCKNRYDWKGFRRKTQDGYVSLFSYLCK
ncbi:hypothetical protein [Ruminococcus sp. NK3A76]|uniref:hypothetical protein n=1 Tax=Ruminococcus sp. NK3A76 TaxID=877411 RepID=UPI0018DDB8FD|nr:hypothetical protein [Ruminococcus sp. NK3A76]